MAPNIAKVHATFGEKADIPLGLFSVLASVLYAAITGPFRGSTGSMITRFNTSQLQYLAPPFTETYKKFCAANNLTPDIITLPSGQKAFWIGDKSAKYIFIYYHGGGFALEGDENHLKCWHAIQQDAASAGKDFAIFYLEYTLTPHATYPHQIIESVEALQYVLNDLGRSASEVILGGDSAGGNLSLAILSHLSHPMEGVPKVTIDKPLKALVLLAPWVSFRTDLDSHTRNQYKDLISTPVGTMWSNDYLNGKESTPYAEALRAPAEWWKDAKVEQVMVTAGADEILVDPISLWVEKFKSVNPNSITYVIGKNEVHDGPLIEPETTEQTNAIKAFLKARL